MGPIGFTLSRRPARVRRRVGSGLIAMAVTVAIAIPTAAVQATERPVSRATENSVRAAAPAPPNLGGNVIVFDPSMSTSDIQAAVDAIAAQQVDNEMGTQRYALLFKPGVYGSVATPLIVQVGYYTEVAGLGASPTDVVINGHVDVYNRCLAPDNCIALNNFWRSLSNLTINVMGLAECRSSGDFWAVSQASPMRRVNVTGGNLTLMDYCTAGPQYASGGFIADSQTGFVINGSQQQFLVRDSSIGGWSNGVWNQVFSGVVGAPPQSFSTTPFDPPPYYHAGVQPLEQGEALPVHHRLRRSRCLRARPPSGLLWYDLGRRTCRRHLDATQSLLHRPAIGHDEVDQHRALERQAPDPHAGRVSPRSDHRHQAG
jgi:hypothetical protein